MRQHLQRQRQVEAAIRTDLLRQRGESEPTPAQRIGVDLLDLRIAVLDKLIAELEIEATTPFTAALERLKLHFDKDSKSVYRTFRGATPVDEPSLPKDISIVFEELVARGIWMGDCPVPDPRWDPVKKP